MKFRRIQLMIGGALLLSTGAIAQTAPMQTSPPAAIAPRAAASAITDAASLEAGANSFTESQARGRFEDAGFTAIQGLTKDDAGFWRGRGMRNGATTDIAMDFQGRIAAGPGIALLGTRSGTGTPRDGTPGNPPGTAAGRALDRAVGTPAPSPTVPTR